MSRTVSFCPPRAARTAWRQGWETFTDAVVRAVNAECNGVVFLLWGKPANTKGAAVSRSKHFVLSSSHPSPLGATKTSAPFIG